jgi:hypothetical protein
VLDNPRGESLPVPLTSRDREDDLFLYVNRGRQFEAIQNENDLESSMTNALVAIDEGMILNEEIPERRRLLSKGRIESWSPKDCRG